MSRSVIPLESQTIRATIALDGSLELTDPKLPGTSDRVVFVTAPPQTSIPITINSTEVTGTIPVDQFFQSESLDRNAIASLRQGNVVVLDTNQPLTPSNLVSGTPGVTIGNGIATITGDVITNGDNFVAGRADLTFDEVIVINTPNPSSGGVVGRVALSDDFNPIPIDRFIFNFDYFQNASLTAGGWDLYRYTLGFERTFFNGLASVELRFPFAATLNSDIEIGAESTNTEFGNARMLFKLLIYQDQRFAVAGGIGLTFPTGDDTRVFGLDGEPLVEFNNEAIPLTPYIGVLYTPNKRCSLQSYVAFDVDPNGNPVFANLDNAGLRQVGRISGPTNWQSSTQFSYLFVQNDDPQSNCQALGPFVEFHYRSILEEPDVIRSGSFVIGDSLIGRQEMNLATGVTARFRNRFLLSAGIVIPLGGEEDRTFDFQAGIRFNVLFGPSAFTPAAPNLF
ncbi:MAG: hypothetical protein ACFCD0_16845 [Gemmataceae bacterium]